MRVKEEKTESIFY